MKRMIRYLSTVLVMTLITMNVFVTESRSAPPGGTSAGINFYSQGGNAPFRNDSYQSLSDNDGGSATVHFSTTPLTDGFETKPLDLNNTPKYLLVFMSTDLGDKLNKPSLSVSEPYKGGDIGKHIYGTEETEIEMDEYKLIVDNNFKNVVGRKMDNETVSTDKELHYKNTINKALALAWFKTDFESLSNLDKLSLYSADGLSREDILDDTKLLAFANSYPDLVQGVESSAMLDYVRAKVSEIYNLKHSRVELEVEGVRQQYGYGYQRYYLITFPHGVSEKAKWKNLIDTDDYKQKNPNTFGDYYSNPETPISNYFTEFHLKGTTGHTSSSKYMVKLLPWLNNGTDEYSKAESFNRYYFMDMEQPDSSPSSFSYAHYVEKVFHGKTEEPYNIYRLDTFGAGQEIGFLPVAGNLSASTKHKIQDFNQPFISYAILTYSPNSNSFYGVFDEKMIDKTSKAPDDRPIRAVDVRRTNYFDVNRLLGNPLFIPTAYISNDYKFVENKKGIDYTLYTTIHEYASEQRKVKLQYFHKHSGRPYNIDLVPDTLFVKYSYTNTEGQRFPMEIGGKTAERIEDVANVLKDGTPFTYTVPSDSINIVGGSDFELRDVATENDPVLNTATTIISLNYIGETPLILLTEATIPPAVVTPPVTPLHPYVAVTPEVPSTNEVGEDVSVSEPENENNENDEEPPTEPNDTVPDVSDVSEPSIIPPPFTDSEVNNSPIVKENRNTPSTPKPTLKMITENDVSISSDGLPRGGKEIDGAKTSKKGNVLAKTGGLTINFSVFYVSLSILFLLGILFLLRKKQ